VPPGVRALNPKTGATLPWHPKLQVGDNTYSSVHAITIAGSTVYIDADAGLETVSRYATSSAGS